VTTLIAQPLTPQAFAPYGEVLSPDAADMRLINDGLCERHHDLATLHAEGGRIGISLFQAQLRPLPLIVNLLERHPNGSQCFVPMGHSDYIVTVAPDKNGRPGAPLAFLAKGNQPINLRRGTWHGVLAPITGSGLFAVIDRIGPGSNLDEHPLDTPLKVSPP